VVVRIASQHRFESVNNRYDKLAHEIEYAVYRAGLLRFAHAVLRRKSPVWLKVPYGMIPKTGDRFPDRITQTNSR
jgi:hypothetical protein